LPNAFSSLLPQEETVTSPVAESLREVFAKLSETRDDIIDRSRLWARNSAIRRALASRDTKGPSKPDAEIAIAAAVSDGHFDLELPFDAELREKIATWLEGAQNLLGGAFGHQARFGVSALAGASRDATGPSEPDAEIAIAVTATDDGYFDFELSAETVLQLIVKRQTADGEPVCAMVFGRSGTEFFQVCALSRLGTKNLRTPEIVLPAGAYTLCVPVAAAEQNGE
jgi:hypothetical protein